MKIEIAEIEQLKKDHKELELNWLDYVMPVVTVAIFFVGMYIYRYYNMLVGYVIWVVGFGGVVYIMDKNEKKKSYYFEELEDEYDDEDYDEDDDYYDDDYEDE